MESKNVSESMIGSGKFLSLKTVIYQDGKGESHKWECCNRNGSNKAVSVIPIKKKSKTVVLIREFRPPLGKHVVGFPAGLVDGNEDASETAKRELFEETGYTASETCCFGETEVSGGLTGELVVPVVAYIDDELLENESPRQHLQDNEEIELFEVPLGKLEAFANERRRHGDVISGRLMNVIIGMQVKFILDGLNG